jgi:Protein of unknown function (DUF3106)
MAPKPRVSSHPSRAFVRIGVAFLLCSVAAVLVAPLPATAQDNARAGAAEEGPRWSEVSAADRLALKPLEAEWSGIGADSKLKWLEMAGRFPSLPADERARIQARMSEWARMSPQERGRVRLNFQEAKQAAPRDRQAQWDAYQALTEEQKRQLAARAAPADARRAPSPSGDQPATAKSNIVPNPAHAQPLRQVAPTVVQAQPGATTTLITRRAAPPGHQQTGLPKISATPEFVDRATLLPQRGPQGAAALSPSASAPRTAPAR